MYFEFETDSFAVQIDPIIKSPNPHMLHSCEVSEEAKTHIIVTQQT
jgi:hypothetical protein